MSAEFLSTYSEHKIIMDSGGVIFTPNGDRVIKPGKVIQFSGNRYCTDDEKEIEFLRNLPMYGRIVSEPKREDYQKAIKEKKVSPPMESQVPSLPKTTMLDDSEADKINSLLEEGRK